MSNLQVKILAKETAIYGASSIVGKFLNWMLVPLYTYVLEQQSDYGIVTNLYAWTALVRQASPNRQSSRVLRQLPRIAHCRS